MNNCVIENNTLVKYNGKEESIVIDNVDTIGEKAFEGNNTVSSITIAKTVKFISQRAFQCCYGLVKVIVENDAVVLGEGAFNNCPKLEEVVLPNSILEIPDSCFFACASLKGIVFPQGLVRIGKEAFSRSAIESVLIPEGVTELDDNAFSNCWALRKVILPSTIKRIGNGAFSFCKYLAIDSVLIPKKTEVGEGIFIGCCKHGFRTIECLVECEDYQFTFHDSVTVELRDDETIAEKALDIHDSVISDTVFEYFEDLFFESINQYEVKEDGFYCIADILNDLYVSTEQYFMEKTGEIGISIASIGTEEEPETNRDHIVVPVSEFVKTWIKSRRECEASYSDVSGLIEASLFRFEENGKWHYGLMDKSRIIKNPSEWPKPRLGISGNYNWKSKNGDNYEPVLWFGYEDKPINPWAIRLTYTVNDMEFWNYDPENFLERVVSDSSDPFQTWYFCELACEIPDIDDIVKQCPINLVDCVGKDYAGLVSLEKAINQFFLDKFLESQCSSSLTSIASKTTVGGIPFPGKEQLSWDDWPPFELKDEDSLPLNVIYWWAGDMTQVLALVFDEKEKHVVADENNTIGLLKYALEEVLFPESMEWYDLRQSFMAHDYFWFGLCIEDGITEIDELPKWCRETWSVLVENEVIQITNNPKEQKRYCIYNCEHIPLNKIVNAYRQLLDVFRTAIREAWAECTEEAYKPIEEFLRDAERIINTQIKRWEN